MERSWIARLALGFVVLLGLLLGPVANTQAQRVATYSPPQITVGALPGQDLFVNITMEGFELAGGPNAGFRAYWNVQGGTAIPISGQPGTSQATINVVQSVRGVAGTFPVVVCNWVNVGQGEIESCTNPAISAGLVINPPPAFTISPTLPTATQNVPYSVVLTVTGGTVGPPGNPYNFAITGGSLPPGLSLNEKDGTIQGTPTANGTLNFTVTATDLSNVSTSRASTLVVRPPVSISTTSPLPPATIGVPYSTSFQATGGPLPSAYQWTVTSGTLPTGLGPLPLSGVLSGTPTVAGLYTFSVQVQDASGTDSRSFQLNVRPPVTFDTAPTLPNGTADSFYSQVISVSGGQAPFSWELINDSSLPPGLILEAFNGSNTRELSGVPTQQGTFQFTVRVADSEGRFADRQFSVTFGPPLVITTNPQLPFGTLNLPYANVTLAATGGQGGYSWTTDDGVPMPPGMDLSENGVISGTPTQEGDYEIPIVVFDSASASGSQLFTFNVAPPITFTTTSPLNDAVRDRSYSATINITGGKAPFTWALAPGSSLPTGLTLTPPAQGTNAHFVQGTPTVEGTFNFTLRVTDDVGRQADQAYALTIRPALAIITTSPLPPGTTGVAYNVTLQGVGGFAPYYWDADPQSLPPGITLNETSGVLSGTPTQTGFFNFSVSMMDDTEGTTGREFTLVVSNPLIITTTSPLPDAVQGNFYEERLVSQGGSMSVHWTVAPGSTLPPGLQLVPEELIEVAQDGSNGSTAADGFSCCAFLEGTPTTEGVYTFTLRATDDDGRQQSVALQLTVQGPLAIVTDATLPPGTLGVAYSVPLQATGGIPPYFWTTIDGVPVAPGLMLSESGVISGTPTEQGTFSVPIEVIDQYENIVTRTFNITIRPPVQITTAETLASGVVGTAYNAALAATGGNPPYTWSLVSGASLPPGMTLSSGGILGGTPTLAGTFNFGIRAQDPDGSSNTRVFSITIIDSLGFTAFSQLPAGAVGTAYSQLLTAGGGNPPYQFALAAGSSLPPGLLLDRDSGRLSGTPTEPGFFSFAVMLSDSTSKQVTGTFTLRITGPLQLLTGTPLPNATRSVAYQATIRAQGGSLPYLFSLAPGSTLPPGLALASRTGILSGTPTQGGVFSFTVQVRDVQGAEVSRDYQLTVISALAITSSSPLPGGSQGVAYSFAFTATGGSPAYLWSLVNGSTLPPGLTLNANTGVLSGTPTTNGNFSFTVRVTDSVGTQAILTVALPIGQPLTILTGAQLPGGQLGVTYNREIQASGGTQPYSFATLPASLPPGIALDPATGILSGTPSMAGSFTFPVTVRDANQVEASRTFVLVVTEDAPALSILSETLPDGLRDNLYSAAVLVSGGMSPLTFSLANGALPPGITGPSAAGVLSGTPTQAGAFTFTIRVEDSEGQFAERTFTVQILGTLRFVTSSPLPGGTLGQAVNLVLQADGGFAPYTFALGNTPLPAGITLAANGTLSGIPTAAFNGGIAFRVTDAATPPESTERVFQWRISSALVILTSELPTAVVGQSYSQAILADGGSPAYQYAVVGGSVPPGMVLSPQGNLTGAPTAPGVSTFTVRVTDLDGRTAERSFTLNANPPAVSSVVIRPTTPNPAPNAQQPVQVILSQVIDAALDGTLTLQFAPSATPGSDDPAIQFVSGGRTANFQIPAGTTAGLFGGNPNSPGIQTGTVAGEIRITAALRRDGFDVTPTPAPTEIIVIPAVAPTISDLSATRNANGLSIVVRGFSTPRNMTSATVTFTPRAGATVSGPLTFTVDLAAAFTAWYSSAASAQHGSRFQLTIPVTLSGESADITGVSVQLRNSIGQSNLLSTTF